MQRTPEKQATGFTVTEILLVAGLLVFLAAIVVVTKFGRTTSCRSAKEQTTCALLQRLGMGINKYYGTYRVYPAEASMTSTNRSTSIYSFLCPAGGTPLIEFNAGEVRDFNGTWWVVDAWGNRIVYCAQSTKEAEVGNFMLFSPGKNGIEGDADDFALTKVKY